jgi:hypothetical protein
MPVGIFPKLPEERRSLHIPTTAIYSKGGEGDTHPELPRKGKGEAEGWGKRISRLNA